MRTGAKKGAVFSTAVRSVVVAGRGNVWAASELAATTEAEMNARGRMWESSFPRGRLASVGEASVLARFAAP